MSLVVSFLSNIRLASSPHRNSVCIQHTLQLIPPVRVRSAVDSAALSNGQCRVQGSYRGPAPSRHRRAAAAGLISIGMSSMGTSRTKSPREHHPLLRVHPEDRQEIYDTRRDPRVLGLIKCCSIIKPEGRRVHAGQRARPLQQARCFVSRSESLLCDALL